jgi:uroporphyrinogen decarboxylase
MAPADPHIEVIPLPTMTPRQFAIAALRRERPEGLVPHMELEFQLTKEVFGREALRSEHLEGVTGPRRKEMLQANAQLWVEVAQRYKWSVITGTHWLPRDDQCECLQYIREIAGDTYMLSVFADGTYSLPSGENMMEHVIMLRERPDEAKQQAQRSIEANIEHARAVIEAGAEVCFMCADYCFNVGPFLSPPMFAEFVTPYLAQLVDALHDMNAYAVKHTDGDIMPILDQIVGTGVDAIHSIDPQAGMDIREVRRLYPHLCLFGNVECAQLQSGTPETIRDSALYCLEYGGVDTGAYFFTSSNCIFKGVPIESYDLMLRIRDEYGYPGAKRPVEGIAPPRRMGERA